MESVRGQKYGKNVFVNGHFGDFSRVRGRFFDLNEMKVVEVLYFSTFFNKNVLPLQKLFRLWTEQLVLAQLRQMPEGVRQEVLNFIGYLSLKYNVPVVQPTPIPKKHFGRYRGVLKTGLSVQEIEQQLKNSVMNGNDLPFR